MPLGVAASLVAGLALVPVLLFDRFEALAQDVLGIDGGPQALAVVVALFFAVWVVGAAGLALLSPRPRREGVIAGIVVALVMGVVLVRIAVGVGDWRVVAFLWPLFGGLALACGAAAGAAARAYAVRRGVDGANG